MIRVEGLVVRYPGAARAAVNDITFNAPAGRVTALVGPNGSGKSTIVHAMLGRVPLERGQILIEGVNRSEMSQRTFAQRVAVIPQREDVVFPMPVRDFVELGRHPHGAEKAGHVVSRAIERSEITHLAGRRTDELSGGEWQRVRIAIALAQDTRVLVLDEPTTFLDIAHEMSTFELLDELASEGITVLLVSHQLSLIARFAHALVLLHEGRVAAAGTAEEVLDPGILERVYEWPLVVATDPIAHAPILVPLRRSMNSNAKENTE
jgi:iron complex transport system ATP-binding protein